MMKTHAIENVLVPTDFSELSAKAMRMGGILCARHGARLTLLHVVQANRFLTPNATGTPRLVPQWVNMATRNLKKQAHILRDRYRIEVEPIVQCGDTGTEINRCIEARNIDNVIIGLDESTDDSNDKADLVKWISTHSPAPVHILAKQRAEYSNQVLLVKEKIRAHKDQLIDNERS